MTMTRSEPCGAHKPGDVIYPISGETAADCLARVTAELPADLEAMSVSILKISPQVLLHMLGLGALDIEMVGATFEEPSTSDHPMLRLCLVGSDVPDAAEVRAIIDTRAEPGRMATSVFARLEPVQS